MNEPTFSLEIGQCYEFCFSPGFLEGTVLSVSWPYGESYWVLVENSGLEHWINLSKVATVRKLAMEGKC